MLEISRILVEVMALDLGRVRDLSITAKDSACDPDLTSRRSPNVGRARNAERAVVDGRRAPRSRPGVSRLVSSISLGLLLACAVPARAQSGENVAVIINDNSPASRMIGEYYAIKRSLPPSNVIHIATSGEEEIDRRTYATSIEWPIRVRLTQQALQDRILYLVLTKGVPLRIAGTSGRNGTLASVDSELTLLYRRMTGEEVSPLGTLDNPYFLNTKEISQARRFTHREQDLLLVTRLDGYSVDDALALIDRGSAAAMDGTIVLNGVARAPTVSDWISTAVSRLTKQGFGERVVTETPVGVADARPILGYFASSSDTSSSQSPRTMNFVPGSLAVRLADADARTFRERTTVQRSVAGGDGMLLGDFVRAGVTGAAGYVGDPSAGSIVRPDILFPAYLAGLNLAEAFYLAMPHLTRRAVVVGDPLCAPFRRTASTRAEIEAANDPLMELPQAFATRRLATMRRDYPHVPDGALMIAARANAYEKRGDAETARRLLEAATAVAPDFATAQAQLAVLYDRFEQRDWAIDRYRRALEAQPPYVRGELVEISNSPGRMEVRQLAMNNLAYDLAVYKRAPGEALSLARKGLAYSPDDPELLDTLGWIEHLAGDDKNAIVHLRSAVARTPANPAVWLHAAIVAAAVDMKAEAEKNLNTALQLNPEFAASDEVAAIRSRLQSDRPR